MPRAATRAVSKFSARKRSSSAGQIEVDERDLQDQLARLSRSQLTSEREARALDPAGHRGFHAGSQDLPVVPGATDQLPLDREGLARGVRYQPVAERSITAIVAVGIRRPSAAGRVLEMEPGGLPCQSDVPEPEPDQANQVAIAGDRTTLDPAIERRGQACLVELDVVLADAEVRDQSRRGVGAPSLHDPAFQAEEEPAVSVVGKPPGVGRGKLPDGGALERDVAVGILPEPLPAVLEAQAPRRGVRPRLAQKGCGVALLGKILHSLGDRLLSSAARRCTQQSLSCRLRR